MSVHLDLLRGEKGKQSRLPCVRPQLRTQICRKACTGSCCFW